jgi:hypothetical protein
MLFVYDWCSNVATSERIKAGVYYRNIILTYIKKDFFSKKRALVLNFTQFCCLRICALNSSSIQYFCNSYKSNRC